MIHQKETMTRVFIDLRDEIQHDDPNWEQVLFQIIMSCQEADCYFSLQYDPRFKECSASDVGTVNEYGKYMVEFSNEMIGSFLTLEGALTATVSFVLKNIHRLRV